MPQWTESDIQTHVTDANTLHDGRALARVAKWSGLGRDDHAAWGLAQGSGKNLYRVCVAIDDAATKCSCPSRKFPCKHAVGLMFLLAADMVALSDVRHDAPVAVELVGKRKVVERVLEQQRAKDDTEQAQRAAVDAPEPEFTPDGVVERGSHEPQLIAFDTTNRLDW